VVSASETPDLVFVDQDTAANAACGKALLLDQVRNGTKAKAKCVCRLLARIQELFNAIAGSLAHAAAPTLPPKR
jgi:hypothetical protein